MKEHKTHDFMAVWGVFMCDEIFPITFVIHNAISIRRLVTQQSRSNLRKPGFYDEYSIQLWLHSSLTQCTVVWNILNVNFNSPLYYHEWNYKGAASLNFRHVGKNARFLWAFIANLHNFCNFISLGYACAHKYTMYSLMCIFEYDMICIVAWNVSYWSCYDSINCQFFGEMSDYNSFNF